MSTVLTLIRVDVDVPLAGQVRTLVDQLDGVATEVELVPGRGRERTGVVVGFHLAADATAAALRLAGALPPASRARLALATGDVDTGDGRHRGGARRRVDRLVASAPDGTVLLASTTAVMVANALPAGVEAVAVAVADGERVYELRPGGTGDDDATASNLGWAHRAAAGPVVGRAGPLARLEGAWTATVSGDHRLVVLSGDPGIGKTTVAAEHALRVHAAGGVVLYGRWDEEGLAPYQAVREALGSYAAACPRSVLRRDVAAHADELARLLPDLGARVGGVRAPLVDDPDAERLRLFDAVRHWLGALASRHPVLVVLDDLQWAEHSSLRLLRHLVDDPPGGPVLVVLTLRDGDVEGMGPLHALGTFEDEPGVDRVDLPGLDVDGVVELVAQVLGRAGAVGQDAADVRWLADETAGNPLLLHEILRGLEAGDPATALARARAHLPESLHDVVRWRLAALSADVRDTLAVAALAGTEFSLPVLATAQGVGVVELRHRLDVAVRAGVVHDTDDHDVLAFTHAVVRRALQDDVPPERARAVHRSLALALSEGPGPAGSAAEIAHHHLRAADPGTAALAIRWARTAADQARRETAFEGAVAFLAGALDVQLRFGGDGRTERELACELHLDLADAHDRAGEFTARDRRYLEAADLARELDRADLFSRAALGYGGRLPATPAGNPTARRLLEDALARLRPDDSRPRALVLARLAHVRHGDAPHAQRRALADEAEAMARRLGAPVVVASVLGSRVLTLDGPDDVDDHLEIGAEIIRIGEQTGDPDLVLQGARARIHPLFVVGAHDAARDLAERFAELAGTVQHPDHLRLVAMWRILWAALEGRFDDAERQAEALRLRLDVAGHPQATAIRLTESFVVRWLRGDLAPARAALEALSSHTGGSLTWWALGAWVDAATGDGARAQARLAERPTSDLVGSDAGYQWLSSVVATATAASLTGDTGWAAVSYEMLAPYRGRNAVLGYVAYLGAIDHHLGTVATVLGRTDDAVAHLGAALERHRTIAARPWVALSAAWLANALAERGRRADATRARELRDEALAIASEIGVAALPPPHPELA
ncbi:MAG TPA: AAA family ATPase [Acidimicrobiales bacterium]|nr:AAA family ATPase [Acidimicrobiales bacterium]